MKDPTPIASFDHAEPAEIVALRLRDACFHAVVVDTSGEEFWTLCGIQPRGHHQVVVPLAQSERGLSWLREFDAAEQLLARAVRCPHCGSTRVEIPQRVGRQTGELFVTGIDSSDHDFHCGKCKRAWPYEPEANRLGVHLAA
jgi:hypothetical protein